MRLMTWACVLVLVVGLILFLYGANYYDSTVGWAGVVLAIGDILVFIILYIYSSRTKEQKFQNP